MTKEGSSEGSDALLLQQRRVQHTLLSGLALAALCLAPVVAIEAVRVGKGDARLWGLLGLMLGFVLLRAFEGRLQGRLAGGLLLALMALTATHVSTLRGLTPGSTALHLMLLLLSTLLFGKRGAIAGSAVCIASMLIAATLLLGHFVTPLRSDFWDPLRPMVWVRYAIAITTLGGISAVAFAQLIEGLDDAARRLRLTLEKEREERARREKAQAALERSQRLEAMGQLAGGIAHDLANSLMVIGTHAELIHLDRAVSPETRDSAEQIIGTVGVTRELLGRLTSLGRSDTGRVEQLALGGPLAWLERSLRGTLPTNIALAVKVRTEARVAIDPGRLEQALLNLALNARDAMPFGGQLAFEVTGETVERLPVGWDAAPGRFVAIACRDTGTGMDEGTLNRIFEPFFTTKEAGRGTGLGLASVRRLVYDSHGFITVESRTGAGTEIRVFLPEVGAPAEGSAARDSLVVELDPTQPRKAHATRQA